MDEKGVKFQNGQTRFLLWLGTALVMLAGIIFVSTTWNTLTEIAKIGTLAGVSVVFAGASWFTKRKLKLNNTSEAFYLLAQVFFGIMLLAMWTYHFMWEGATLETIGFIYLCWLAVWGVFHENGVLKGIFFFVSMLMLLYRWIMGKELLYPVAVLDVMYVLVAYIYKERRACTGSWLGAYAVMIVLALLGLMGENAGYSLWIVIGTGCMDLARKNVGRRRRFFITGAVLAGCAAFYAQNFFEIGSVIRVEFNLLPMVAFAWSLGPIWKDEETKGTVDITQFLIALGCLNALGVNILKFGDHLLGQKLFHTVIMACVCLGMVLLSTHYRSTTGESRYIKWQILGAVGLVGLILHVTWSFWASLGWWVYLLIAGVSLIAVAAMKEVRDREQERNRIDQLDE